MPFLHTSVTSALYNNYEIVTNIYNRFKIQNIYIEKNSFSDTFKHTHIK